MCPRSVVLNFVTTIRGTPIDIDAVGRACRRAEDAARIRQFLSDVGSTIQDEQSARAVRRI